MTHSLKCWPEYFAPLWNHQKNFEIRKNDRDFKIGDTLELREWSPATANYTGRCVVRQVVYVCLFPDGLRDGYVALGLR